MTFCASVHSVCVPSSGIYFGDRNLARSCAVDLCGGIPSPVRVVKAVMMGYAKHPPQVLPTPRRAVTVRQYRLPGGHREIDATIAELTKVDIVCSTQSPFNSPMWPVWKPDGSWWMTVDYRELNKMVPPVHAAMPFIHGLMDQLTTALGTHHYVVDLLMLVSP